MEHDANIQTGSVLKLVDRHQIHHNQRLFQHTELEHTPFATFYQMAKKIGISFIIGVENRGIADWVCKKPGCVETTLDTKLVGNDFLLTYSKTFETN